MFISDMIYTIFYYISTEATLQNLFRNLIIVLKMASAEIMIFDKVFCISNMQFSRHCFVPVNGWYFPKGWVPIAK